MKISFLLLLLFLNACADLLDQEIVLPYSPESPRHEKSGEQKKVTDGVTLIIPVPKSNGFQDKRRNAQEFRALRSVLEVPNTPAIDTATDTLYRTLPKEATDPVTPSQVIRMGNYYSALCSEAFRTQANVYKSLLVGGKLNLDLLTVSKLHERFKNSLSSPLDMNTLLALATDVRDKSTSQTPVIDAYYAVCLALLYASVGI